MPEKLRRKGRGRKGEESNRPMCPNCNQDLKRSYTREYNPDKFSQFGWICKKCQYVIWDKEE